MLFNSFEFILFFFIACALFSTIKNKRLLILALSLMFYAYWSPIYLSLILVSTVWDYKCGKLIFQTQNKSKKKSILFLSIFFNLGILGYFKYSSFFLETLYSFNLINTFDQINILLPIGISFYTFQTMSYSIDIYRGEIKPETNFLNFFLFVTYFPQLVAGPIERAKDMLPRLKNLDSRRLNIDSIAINRIFIGFIKKVVIADRLSVFVAGVYGAAGYSTVDGLLAMYFFSIQIYCDFSGYCDIAVGVSRVFGVDLMENFKSPYLAFSFKDFWSRWHISLSRWFRDYLYIPLGGSRVGRLKAIFNLLIVFMVSGLWHGASWNFVFWGALHGVVLCVERFIPPKKRFFNKVICFNLITVTWVFFRLEDFNSYLNLVNSLRSMPFSLGSYLPHGELILSLFFFALVFLCEYLKENKVNIYIPQLFRDPMVLSLACGLLLSCFYATTDQFIYFQF